MFIEICTAYVTALDDAALATPRQREIAAQAGMFLAACAKVGLIALIDEATGYQYDRAEAPAHEAARLPGRRDAEVGEDFPDQLWSKFGGSPAGDPRHSSPAYWGKLVMDLSTLLDKAWRWLRETRRPRHGRLHSG